MLKILLIIPIIVQCVNVSTLAQMDGSSEIKYGEDCDTALQEMYLRHFLCQSGFLWYRVDSLKQWKKRRRLCFSITGINNIHRRIKRSPVADGPPKKITADESQANLKSIVTSSLISQFKEQWPVKLWRQYGLFSDDYLLLINPHWLHFPPPPPKVHYTMGGLYIAMMVIGCTGNAIVLLMYLRCRTLRTPGNILVANLALSDFLMLAKTPVFVFNSFNLGPALGKTGCLIYGFLGGLTGTTSIATLSAIALDRYWAVVKPLEPLRALTAVRAKLLAVSAWIYAAIFSVIPAIDFGYGHYVPEGYLTSCSFDYLTEETAPKYFIFVFFCAAWVAPLCTISFCYLKIIRVVVYNRNVTTVNQEQRLSSRHVKEQVKRKAEIKLAFLVIAVIALFFISWTPYAIVSLLGIFGQKQLITPISSMIPALFCKTAACINPFIYIITHPKFRKEIHKLLYRDKSKRVGTLKTIGYSIEPTKSLRASKDFSDTDVEVVEMKDIPYHTETKKQKTLKSISARVSDREGSQRSVSMKSFEENAVRPPSWYVKPQFAKKRSFN